MIGRTVSHYRLLEKLGEGGMGVVYKAHDLTLKRTVALKFLPPHALSTEEQMTRFLQEARAAAALSHPNICTIFEIGDAEGQTFIAMEYLGGGSLKEKIRSAPLKPEEIVRIGVQIAEGLCEAQAKGIVHRDIKPANIMMTERGTVKILDFGLAKLAGQGEITRTGTTVGTVAYMSPEQAQGKEVDHRTDIWSLGVVLYEMSSGQLPFRGDYEQATVYSILNEAPLPISRDLRLPAELLSIISKALSKDPDHRYESAADISRELKFLRNRPGVVSEGTTAFGRREPSIAVLPLANLSADKEQEYFCDGMAEEIINALTNVGGLRVVSRTSAFMFKDRQEDIREIGRRLNVETLLEGSVRKSGKRLRITAQLVNVSNGYHLWSQRYDREMEDVFAIHDEISLAIVDELKGKLLGKEKEAIVRRHTNDPEAYNSYLRGRYYWNKRTDEGFRKGIECFQAAIERDAGYVLAYAGLADCYNLLGWYCFEHPKETFPKAKAAAEKALQIDCNLAEALTSLAYARLFYDWDYSDAESKFKLAMRLNPGYGTVHQWYAEYLLVTGQAEEAIEEARKALELDPLCLVFHAVLGLAYYISFQFERAIDQFKKMIEMDPNFFVAHFGLGEAYTLSGQHKEAVAEFKKAIALLGRSSLMLSFLAQAYAAWGKRNEAEKVLDELDEISRTKAAYVPPYFRAVVHVNLGDLDEAFERLNTAHSEHDPWLLYLKVDPAWIDLRSDPRYVSVLRRMGLREAS
ncbi:MAG: protein kinase [Candidatus Eiseniibacteriota bacterium]|nr:MAG: protein kinase [Candidatus Eisenbacteria bacterium]